MSNSINNGLKWSNDDDKKLIDYYLRNKKYSNIANMLGRSEDAIKARLVKTYVYPVYIRPAVYNDNNFNMKYFAKSYDEIVNTYGKMFNIEKDEFVKFMKYADKNIQMFIKYTDANYVNMKNKKAEPFKPVIKKLTFNKVSDTDDSECTDDDSDDSDDEDYVVKDKKNEILKKLEELNRKMDILLKLKY